MLQGHDPQNLACSLLPSTFKLPMVLVGDFQKMAVEVRRHNQMIKKAQLPCQYPNQWLPFLKNSEVQ